MAKASIGKMGGENGDGGMAENGKWGRSRENGDGGIIICTGRRPAPCVASLSPSDQA